MKKNKKVLTILICILVVILIAAIILFVLKKNNPSSGNLEQGTNVTHSLSATGQAAIDSKIQKDLKNNKYSLDNAKVYLNPYNNSPLTALIIFRSKKNADVEVTIKGKNNNDLNYTIKGSKEHFIPIYALYSDFENTVEIKLSTGESKSFKIKTEKIENLPAPEVVSSDITALDNSLYFITSPLQHNPIGVDEYGEVRWYSTTKYFHDLTSLKNGHLLVGTEDDNEIGHPVKIEEIDLLGRIYTEYDIPQSYLNDFFLKDDGNIIVTSQKDDRNTFSEYIIEIDSNTGNIVKTIDLYDIFQKIDPEFTNSITNSEYFFNSGIEYYKDSDTLLLTYWGGEFVISLNYSNSSINWILSNPENFSSAFDSYLLKGDENFKYPKSMHSATLTGNTLKVFDNGYNINKEEKMLPNLAGSYSSANTYNINGKNINLTKEINKDKSLFSYALADYRQYGEYEVVLFGRELLNADYTQNVDINHYYSLYSYVIVQKGDKSILEFKVPFASLTVEKYSLDKQKFSFEFETSKTITSMEKAAKSNITEEIIAQTKSAEKNNAYKFGFSNNILESNISFFEDEEAKVVLIDDSNSGAVYDIKVKGKSKSDKVLVDLKPGKYNIYLIFNEIMYNTDSYIEVK